MPPRRPEPLRTRLIAALTVLAASLSVAGHAANPCLGKNWVNAPVLALSGDSSGGIGGSGHGDEDSGIGGTGRSGEDAGLGGTGHTPAPSRLAQEGIGGTGIVGVIAGFASICVNELEIHYDRDTLTRIDGLPARSADLTLGQIVTVTASRSAGELWAEDIAVRHVVSGPVDRVDAATGRVFIQGQSLQLPAPASAAIRVGQRLTVSGNRLANGEIIATRIEPQTGEYDLVSGPVEAVTPRGFRIAGLDVLLPADVADSPPQPGMEVLVRGVRLQGGLRAEAVVRDPGFAFTRPVRQVNLQGYVRQTGERSLDLEGTTINLSESAHSGIESAPVGSRVRISAQVAQDGRITAERVRVERPAPAVDVAPALRAAPPVPTRTGVERPAPFVPDLQRPEVARPEMTRPEMTRPEITRPEFVRPDLPRDLPPRPDRPDRGR